MTDEAKDAPDAGQLVLLPGAERVRAAAAPELPQKDDLCGPFWALAAVRALVPDIAPPAAPGGAAQDEAARAAGTHRWAGPGETLPPGQPPRRDHAADLPVTRDADLAGTDVTGVVGAITSLSHGEVAATRFPVAGWRDGPQELASFLDALRGEEDADPIVVLLNVATEQYLFPVPGRSAPERFLAEGDLAGYRGSSWRVGHFVALLGWREGPGGRLYLVQDSYPLRALAEGRPVSGAADEIAAAEDPWQHEQPDRALWAALRRPGRSGGEIVVVAAAGDPRVRDAAARSS